jgi:hypothetical protein
MSETLTAVILDAATGEVIERPLTEDEIVDLEIAAAESASLEAERQAKAAARSSALAKLAELGLTEEEVAAL